MTNNSKRPIPTIFTSPAVSSDNMMLQMNDKVLEVRRELIRSLELGKREIELALEALHAGQGVNSMGILQSTALSIDAKAAQLHDATHAETLAAYHLGYAKPTADTCWK